MISKFPIYFFGNIIFTIENYLKKIVIKIKKVLIEFNSLCDSHIVYSYLAKYFHKIVSNTNINQNFMIIISENIFF